VLLPLISLQFLKTLLPFATIDVAFGIEAVVFDAKWTDCQWRSRSLERVRDSMHNVHWHAVKERLGCNVWEGGIRLHIGLARLDIDGLVMGARR
jgi:hypothetical protein